MKTFKKLFLFLLVVSVASCDVGDDEELNYGNGAYVAQFPFAEKTGFFLKDDAVVYDYDLPIEIVGGNGLALNSDLAVAYEVDLVNSTAVEGVNYDFVETTNATTIPAGSTFSTIKLKVYSGTLDDQNPPVLVLKLTSADAGSTTVVTSGNKGSVALTLQGTCTSDLAGPYAYNATRISPAGGPYVASDVITELSPGTYRTSFVGNYYIPGTPPTSGTWNVLDASGTPGYTFKEVCGRVRVEEQNLANIYSNLVKQTDAQYAASSVNPATGVITVEYSIFFTNNTVERPYRSVYTP